MSKTKVHVPSSVDKTKSACGGPLAAQYKTAYCRSVVTCNSCKKTFEYKLLK